jgi:DNA-binding Xre family transcriptional regulator
MAEQRRIGYNWNLRQVMAKHNLWKTTDLIPLLRSRGINLSNAQVHRLVTATPDRIPARTFAALCDIFDCTPNDLFEPFVEMRAAATADAPRHPSELGVRPGDPVARRIKVVTDDE